MIIDDGSLLAYCGIGFGTLFASYAMMLDTTVSKRKFSAGHFQAAFFNSIRMVQISSAVMMGCCLLLILRSLCSSDVLFFFSTIARYMACWATLFAICAFSIHYRAALGAMRVENNLAKSMHQEYIELNTPPTTQQG